MYVLIYDSKCIFCCTFVKYLNIFADKSDEGFAPIYIISPNDIYKIKEINSQLFKSLDLEKIEILSKSSIIFLSENNLTIRVKALIKLSMALRPRSLFISFMNTYLNDLLSFLLNPLYIIFAKNRYFISKFTKPFLKFLLGSNKNSCLISTTRIKFL